MCQRERPRWEPANIAGKRLRIIGFMTELQENANAINARPRERKELCNENKET